MLRMGQNVKVVADLLDHTNAVMALNARYNFFIVNMITDYQYPQRRVMLL